jgi:hypothetical protein
LASRYSTCRSAALAEDRNFRCLVSAETTSRY